MRLLHKPKRVFFHHCRLLAGDWAEKDYAEFFITLFLDLILCVVFLFMGGMIAIGIIAALYGIYIAISSSVVSAIITSSIIITLLIIPILLVQIGKRH